VTSCGAEEQPKTQVPSPQVPEGDEKLRRGLELYAKFPPPEWGRHVLERLEPRLSQPLKRGGPITVAEREFLAEFDLWEMAREHVERTKSENSPK